MSDRGKWRLTPPPNDECVPILAAWMGADGEVAVVQWRDDSFGGGWCLASLHAEGYTGAPIETRDPDMWMPVSDLFAPTD